MTEVIEAFEHAQALNPLNPDHLRGLAKSHRLAATLATDPSVQKTHLDAANDAYAQILVLSPQNVLSWNEWASFHSQLLHDEAEVCRLLEHSLELDSEFEETQQLYADICLQALPERPSNLDFEE